MKKTILILSFAIIAILGTTLTSCSGENNQQNSYEETIKQIPKTAYACPMKCEGDKTYDKQGKCPVCGMDLKEVK